MKNKALSMALATLALLPARALPDPLGTLVATLPEDVNSQWVRVILHGPRTH